MRRCTFCCLVLLVLSSLPTSAQEPLNNDSVIKMQKAGMSEELILNMVNPSFRRA